MELVIRSTAIYWFLWLVVRGTGKRSLAEISPLDLLVIVVLGDFVQQGVTQEDMSVSGAMIVISTFVMWMLLGDMVSRRFASAEKALEGQAVLVVRQGQVITSRLRSERLTMRDLLGAAREQGYGDIRDIDFGVLEADGKFSFVGIAPRPRAEPERQIDDR